MHRATRVTALSVALLAALALFATAAAARFIGGTPGNDNLVGTPRSDVILARAGNDRVDGKAGRDFILGQEGNDRLLGQAGALTN